ncbi:MAG: GNAT family N-acetyltransferase [Candidatus Moraniibacteriota bacterium]
MENKFIIGENEIASSDILDLNHLMNQIKPLTFPADWRFAREFMQTGIIISVRDSSKNNMLIGIGMLVPIRKPRGFYGSIEEVVVDEEYRGKGLGKKIVQTLIQKSVSLKMKCVDLKSSSKREVANRIYRSLGFKIVDSNLYRFKI